MRVNPAPVHPAHMYQAPPNPGQTSGYQAPGAAGPGGGVPMQANPAPNPGKKKRKVGIIVAVVAIVVVLLIVLAVVFVNLWSKGGRGYEEVVESYVDSLLDGNAKAILDLLPETTLDHALEEVDVIHDALDEKIGEASDALQGVVDQLGSLLGEKFQITHEITGDEDLSESELEELKDAYHKLGVRLTAAKTVTVALTIQYGDHETTLDMEVSVLKVGRSWYLDALSMVNLV